jgi:multiple sugar transport system permease protein
MVAVDSAALEAEPRSPLRAGRNGPPPSRRLLSQLTGWGFVLPASVIVVGLSIFPAGWAFLISRRKTDLIVPATDVGWANYRLLMDDPGVWAAIRHTLFFTALYVPISIVAGVLLAVALNRFWACRSRGSSPTRTRR